MPTPEIQYSGSDGSRSRSLLFLLLITLALSVLFFFSCLDADLVRAGEARAAEIAREMLERGNLIMPSLNYQVAANTMTKPPLYHWLVAALGSNFDWQNWAMRLPALLAALATIWVVFLLGRLLFGLRAGIYAALVLSTSILFLSNGSAARIDVLFSLLIVASLYCYWLARSGSVHGNWIYGFYALSALAVMAKGPVGLLLPFAIAGYHMLSSSGRQSLREVNLGRGLLLFLLLALPWYVAMVLTAPPELVDRFLFGQVLQWWEGSAGDSDTGGKSVFAYLPHLLLGAFPWSLFLPGAIWLGIREAKRQNDSNLKALLFWFIGGFVLFSLGSKQASRYLMPLMPAFALLLGWYWDHMITQMDGIQRRVSAIAGVVVVLFCLVLLLLLSAIAMDSDAVINWLVQGRNLGSAHQMQAAWDLLGGYLGAAVVCSALAVAAAVVATRGVVRNRIPTTVVGLALVVWILVWPFTLAIKPTLDMNNSVRPVAEEIRTVLPPEAPLYGGGKAYKHAMRWYLRHNITQEPDAQLYARVLNEPESTVLLMEKRPPAAELLAARREALRWEVNYYYVTFFPGE